jgi:hypothetical protein
MNRRLWRKWIVESGKRKRMRKRLNMQRGKWRVENGEVQAWKLDLPIDVLMKIQMLGSQREVIQDL